MYMTLKFSPTGVLTTTPFVELAGAIHRQRLTGSLYLSDNRAERRAERVIYFSHGEVYAAASNLAVDSALALLMRAGRVTQELALRIQQEVSAGRSFSELLVIYGCVSREELNQLRIEHVKSICNSLCEWTSGEYRFTEGSQIAGGRLGVSTKALLIEGALVSSVPARFRELVSDARTWVSADQAATPDLTLQPFAYFLLSCLSQPRNLVVLTESGRMDEPDQEVWQQLYGLSAAGLVEFTTALSPAENPLLAGTATQEALFARAKAQRPAAAPIEKLPEPCTALAFPLQEDPETTKRRRLEAIKRDIKQMRQTLSSSNDDYAVLGLQAGVTPYQVKHAYRNLVNHYHPDRHHAYCDPITLATLSDVLMAIRAAYETAIEHALLAEIISNHAPRHKTARNPESVVVQPAAPPASFEQRRAERSTLDAMRNQSLAELKHRKALSHQTQGEYEAAIRLLSDAVTLAPDCARYHGDLAALLEKVPMRREQAEHHLLRATELEPSNLYYHLQLGSFYRAAGMLSRAEQQFVLALKLDPVDRAAASALEEVVSLKKAQLANAQYGQKRVPKGQGFWARLFNRSVS
jgi:tetratricopeptide (TPR) repeat protein